MRKIINYTNVKKIENIKDHNPNDHEFLIIHT